MNEMARNNQYMYMNEDYIGSALLCIICRRPFKDPIRTPCNHIFCRECITKWVEENSASCFACRLPIPTGNLSRISGPLNNMLDTLRVQCLLCGQANLLRGNFNDHISRTCPSIRAPFSSADVQYSMIGQQSQLINQMLIGTHQPFSSSLYSELMADNRQLRQQCQEQLNQIQQCEIESQRQKYEIERINERCNQHEILINDLQSRIAGTKLSTAKFLSKKPLSSDEKKYYDECKEYYHLTQQPLISIAKEVFDNNSEISSSSIKFGIDEDCRKFDVQEFLNEFCDKCEVNINDITVKQIQTETGSAVLETEICDKFKSEEKKLRIKMIYHKLTDELQKELGKMKIFFMFMGPIESLNNMQKLREEIKLNPKYNRIYADEYIYWPGAINDGRDRGGEPYYCPVGWQRKSFYVTDNFYEKFKGWCICYHGTKFAHGLSILLSGLKPADIAAHGTGIYATPSINYACHPRYAEVKLIEARFREKFFKSGKYIQFVLECRVHPDNIKKIDKETLKVGKTTIDSNIGNKVIEWVIDNQKKGIVDFNDPDSPIICTGVLMRITDEHPGLLPESQWWYESHLCGHPQCCFLGIDLEALEKKIQSGVKCNIIFN